MRWKKVNQNKKRKLSGRVFPRCDMRLFVICNRFAASEDGRMEMKRISWHSPETYRDWFYSLKDRLMDAFGKPKGYALQYWSSFASDWHTDIEMKDGAHHYHILERVKLGGKIYHRPTNHFYYSNDVSEYYKKTVGYELMEKLCSEKIEGKKSITQNIPTPGDAVSALMRLRARYAKLLERPARRREKPRIITGYYYEYEIDARRRVSHSDKQSIDYKAQCHFCLKMKDGLTLARYDGHEICADCSKKIIFG